MQALLTNVRKSSAHNGSNIPVLIVCKEPNRVDWRIRGDATSTLAMNQHPGRSSI